jgi:ssDNA-binding replication factor A large subunit
MKISDLRPGMKNLEIMGTIVDKTMPKTRGDKSYSRATLEDESGRIFLNLWRNQVDEVQVGDLVRVLRAFVHMRTGSVYVSTWSDISVVQRASRRPNE